ncbi:MAG TPA: cupin domain-containing protein [Gaiellaceae bacterium]|nr:cupin domain-containing protein [Gaiellaceae bacterium]
MPIFNLVSGELEPEEDPRPGYHRFSTRVGQRVGGERIGASLYELGEGERVCPYHYHHGTEEWLYVVAGAPTLRTPEGEQALRPGDAVCFPVGPEGAHDVRGPGRVLILSANRWPDVVVYPDSDKLGARPAPYPEQMADRGNFRRSDAVGYWEGEA